MVKGAAAMQRNISLASLKSLKKPGSPPQKLKLHQKLLRSGRNAVSSILNGSSKALSKAVIVLAAVEVRGRRPLCLLSARMLLAPRPLPRRLQRPVSSFRAHAPC